MKKPVVTIDGPSGAGKTTAARRLADHLAFSYMDTGAMYRIVALKVKREGIEEKEDYILRGLLQNLDIRFVQKGEDVSIFSDGEDVTKAIRTPQMGMIASRISRLKMVRDALLKTQRKMGEKGGLVAEGRDAGTVIFPDAEVKFYLDALPHIRAERRFKEFKEQGYYLLYEEVLKDIQKRDHDDKIRDISPLKPASDAIIIDSSNLNINEVIKIMEGTVRRRQKEKSLKKG